MDTFLRDILTQSKTIAVVGLTDNPMRPAYSVSEYMQTAGYRIIPVNPKAEPVLDQKAYARLEEIPDPVDIVNVFRRSEFAKEIVESAITIRARVVWMQEEVVNEEAAQRAREGGLAVVMDRCILKDHRRLIR